MQASNDYSKVDDSRYLEVNPEHLARFLQEFDWEVELDSVRVREFLGMHHQTQEKRECAAAN